MNALPIDVVIIDLTYSQLILQEINLVFEKKFKITHAKNPDRRITSRFWNLSI
jgi:hypothetical protein